MILVALELKIGRHTKVFVNPYDYIFENRTYYIYVIYQNYPSMEKIYGDQMNQFLLQMDHSKGKGGGKLPDENLDPLLDSNLQFSDAHSLNTQKLIMLQDKRGLDDGKNDNIVRLGNNKKLVYDDVTISNCNALDKHVILCNIFPGIENFIGTLRSKSLGTSRPQIVLFSNETQPSIWQQINMFQEVYIMKGSALNPSDLQNCGLSRARAIVVLSRSSDRVSNLSQEFMDADAIFMYKTIRNCDPSVLIIIELNNLSTISFIWQRPIRNPKHNSANNQNIGAKKPKLDASNLQNQHHQVMQEVTVVGSGQRNVHILNNPFAAGQIYFSQLLDTLMCQAYYNPFITELLRQFVKGAAPCNPAYQKIYKRLSLTQCSMHLIPVPNAKEQSTWEFKDLFTRCIQNRIILLGVFKNGNKVPGTVAIPNNRVEKRFSQDEKQCVIINSPTYIVKPADKLYVLSDLKPEELEIFSLDSEKRLRNYRNKDTNLHSSKAKKFKVAQGPQGILDLEYSNQINQMNETLHQIQESIHLMKKDIEIHTNSAKEMLSHKLNVMAKEGHRRLGKK